MSASDPLRAVAAGTLVVTPNNRLARTLVARHDAAMLRAGKAAWPAARVLPWGTWLALLWREAQDAGAAGQRLIAPVESRYLWQRIVGDDPALPIGLVDLRGVAALAAEAWTLVHGWGSGGPSWRAWRETAAAPPGSDPEAFARWAERYQRELEQRDVRDAAGVGDALVAAAGRGMRWQDTTVLLAGFLELTVQQERLLAGLRATGMRIGNTTDPAARGRVERVIAPTPRDEIVMALQWARERALAAPGLRIGLAVNGLAARREEVRALADDILCPALQLPGHADAPRPYDVSLGMPLADDPVAAAALGWIGLAHGALDRAQAASLMRSPYGPGRWSARAGLEKEWIETSRHRITAAEAVAALATVDAAAGVRLRDAVGTATLHRVMAPREWATQWRALLGRCGWPGDAALGGPQYEAQQAFARLLEDFQRLDALGVRLAPSAALALLRELAAETVFQPQGGGGPVAILGVLEAASVDFDALWITSLSGQDWPPAPQPHPLLPLHWQRERGVPRSSAARELAFATRVTERLLRSAADVTVSAPAVLADATARPTALLGGAWPAMTRPEPGDTARLLAAAGAVEAIDDAIAPAFAGVMAPGGTGAIAAQSDCPFMAMARYRLRAEPWPAADEGLSPLERGKLAHALMASFWREVRTHEALVALDADALAAGIAAAASAARHTVPPARWNALPPVVAAAEAERLPGIAAAWIETIERPRSGFTVTRIEQRATVELAGLTFRLTVDRIDELAGGGAAIIDYKTGLVDSTASWFAWRPRAPQLGVYLLALAHEVPPVPVRAIAYGRLKAGDIAAVGFAADVAQWRALADPARQREIQSWAGLEAFYAERLPALAAELRDGVASVTPRGPTGSPCRICARQALCRIHAERGRAASPGEDDDGER